MPGGRTVILPEDTKTHNKRCRFCSLRTRQLPWRLTVAAGDRRAVSVLISDLREMLGDPNATGELIVSGINTRSQRWRALIPASIDDAPDITFSQRSIHDRTALISALANACAPRWHKLPGGALRASDAEDEDPRPRILVLGPPEEYFGWGDCGYCETYRYGSMRVQPHIQSEKAIIGARIIRRVRYCDIELLLMKRSPPLGSGQSADAAHNLRDLLHALGLETRAHSPEIRHSAMADRDFTYIYPNRTRGRN